MSPAQVEYQTQDASLPRRGVASLVLMLIFSYLFYAVLAAAILETPKFKQIFADFKMELPGVTKCVLVAGDFCSRFYLWGFLAPLPALWSIGIWRISNRDARKWARLAAIVVMLGIVVMITLGLVLPMFNLIDGITSHTGNK